MNINSNYMYRACFYKQVVNKLGKNGKSLVVTIPLNDDLTDQDIRNLAANIIDQAYTCNVKP